MLSTPKPKVLGKALACCTAYMPYSMSTSYWSGSEVEPVRRILAGLLPSWRRENDAVRKR